MASFDDRDTQLMGRAFERAWAQIIAECAGELTDLAEAREMLANRILALVQSGESDPEHLARAAMLHFRRRQPSWPDVRETVKPRG